MNRPCGGLSSSAFSASRRFTIAVVARMLAAAARIVVAGYCLKTARQSERNDRVCGNAMCKSLLICTMTQTCERCCSEARTGESRFRSIMGGNIAVEKEALEEANRFCAQQSKTIYGNRHLRQG